MEGVSQVFVNSAGLFLARLFYYAHYSKKCNLRAVCAL